MSSVVLRVRIATLHNSEELFSVSSAGISNFSHEEKSDMQRRKKIRRRVVFITMLGVKRFIIR